jgi:hypothetical protein
MAAVNFSLTPLSAPPAANPVAQGSTSAPQPNAVPAQGAANQSDSVTLTGRAAETQQTGNETAQFGQNAAFFFAERQSFRAANGSATSPSTARPEVPTLPVKLSDENQNGSQGQSTAAGTAKAVQDAEAENVNQQNTMASAANATASNSTSNSQTPNAELAQLDSTLQEIGVNPQSVSLFNRMAMLLYANDPAALRMLVQTLQTGAQLASANGANTKTGTASPTTSSAAQAELQSTQSQILVQALGNAAPANQSIQNPPTGASATRSTQPTTFYLRLEESRQSFAPSAEEAAPEPGQQIPSGQLLNVTA